MGEENNGTFYIDTHRISSGEPLTARINYEPLNISRK